MSEEKSTALAGLKKLGYYIALPLIGLAIIAKVLFSLFYKKDTLKEALVEDGSKQAAAADAKAKAEDAKASADAVGDKIDKLPEDPEWQNKRNKF